MKGKKAPHTQKLYNTRTGVKNDKGDHGTRKIQDFQSQKQKLPEKRNSEGRAKRCVVKKKNPHRKCEGGAKKKNGS